MHLRMHILLLLDGMFCVYVLGSSGLKYISRPMFIYSFSVWITYPLLKWGIEVLYCYCIAVHFSLQICQSLLSRLRCRRRQWQPTPVLLPGKIPWTEEPGRLQSLGLRRVGRDRVISVSLSCIGEGNGSFLKKTPVFLPGESQGQGSLVSCHLWSCTESDTTEAI